MFPDSEIAKSYTYKADKIKYLMQFEIASVIRDVDFDDDLKGKRFASHFDEMTNCQIRKWYGRYATLYSNSM